jgi:hypothetical protein
MSKTFDLGVLYSRSGTYQLLSEALFTGAMSAIESVNAVNGGVKFGHCGGAKVGQFGASALERAALI